MHRLWRATLNSIEGLFWLARHEAAFREELIVLVIAVPISFLLTGNPWMRAALIVSILFVMLVETVNSAIEKLSDHVTPERDPAIKVVKDLGSAAVLLAIVIAGIVWLSALAAALM